jgi:hypothetical protein
MSVPTEITDLIRNSGNSFHAKVARWFADEGWHVVVSPYYMDQAQSKAREIDLVAEKLWPIFDSFGREVDHIAVRLFIECKFISSDAVFWFADKDRDSAVTLVCKNSPFKANNSYTEKHHYLAQSSRVAKLFSTANTKTTENEPFYKALNQSLNAMTSMSGQALSAPTIRKARRTPRFVLDYPIIICSSFDRMFSVDFYAASEAQPIQDNFLLEINYAYIDRNESKRNDYFLVDFVAFDKLNAFASAIDNGATAGAFLESH